MGVRKRVLQTALGKIFKSLIKAQNFVCFLKIFTNRIFAAHSYEIADKTVFRVGNSKLMISFQ